jgi:diguanylate cyclase (GGDEF)-like protein/PAS domain S-box-containing protein
MIGFLYALCGEHDLRLVALAGLVCLLASVTAVSLFHRGRAATGRQRLIWILTAGVTTGCGIWATHFIAMLAYQPGVSVFYDFGLTLLSLLMAMLITGIGFYVAFDARRSSAAMGGAIVGLGVACMHYLGVWAMQLPGHLSLTPATAALSVVVGMVIAMFALIVATRRPDARGTFYAGGLLTLAIVSHHFTAMGALDIIPDPTRTVAGFNLPPVALALGIANAALVILGLSIVATFIARMRERDRLLAMAVNNVSQGVVMFDANERLVACNDRYMEMYGLSPEVLRPGCTLLDLIRHRIATGSLERDAEDYRAELIAGVAQGKTTSWIVDGKDGKALSVINRPFAGGYWTGTHEDITERRQKERELERTKQFLDTVIENVPATIVVKGAHDRRYVLVNRAGERHFGVPANSMIGKTAEEIFNPATAAYIGASDDRLIALGEDCIIDQRASETPGNGTRFIRSRRLPMLGDDGKPKYLLAVVEDITESRHAEERIAHLAHHDPLTDLPNRAAFNDHLQAAIDKAAKAKESFAVICIDLDRFKEVNDVFGHATGDQLLCEVSRRLQDVADGVFLARLGGDEFTVIGTDGPTSAAALAERLLACTDHDLDIGGHHIRIGLSLGVAIYPNDGAEAATLLANADAALYRAKEDGRGNIHFFHAAMDQQLRERRALQHELRSAIEHRELVLHYQPQASVDGEITGFEALIRWHHPTRGLVPPGVFIPIAEESSSIISIGEWTLREACREAASWPNPLQVAINLSPAQFRHGDLAGLVHAVLLETGLPANRLELEITEGVLIGDYSRATSILRRLKLLGVRIAMDDFGTGYSSLSYLQAFPFDKIKIDRAFISNLDRNSQAAAIVRAVIGLGRGLNLPVVAEGVETEDQLAFLTREACDEVQGYLVGRPGPIETYAEMVGREAPAERKAANG